MQIENQRFDVEIETGEILEAELLAVVEIDGQDYAIYSLNNGDGTVDVLASYVVQDEEGYDTLVDIENPKDKQKIEAYLEDIIN